MSPSLRTCEIRTHKRFVKCPGNSLGSGKRLPGITAPGFAPSLVQRSFAVGPWARPSPPLSLFSHWPNEDVMAPPLTGWLRGSTLSPSAEHSAVAFLKRPPPVIPTETLQGKYSYYPSRTEEEAEAQVGKAASGAIHCYISSTSVAWGPSSQRPSFKVPTRCPHLPIFAEPLRCACD